MNDFLIFERDGTTVLVNKAHITAVKYTPSKEGTQQVYLLGGIVLQDTAKQVYGNAIIEVVDFGTEPEAREFLSAINIPFAIKRRKDFPPQSPIKQPKLLGIKNGR